MEDAGAARAPKAMRTEEAGDAPTAADLAALVRRVVREELPDMLRDIVAREVRGALATSQPAPALEDDTPAVPPTFRLEFTARLRENIYAPHFQQSELNDACNRPMKVQALRIDDGKPTKELDGMEIEAAVLQPRGNDCPDELVEAVPRPGRSSSLLAGTTRIKLVDGVAVFTGLRITDNSSKFPGQAFVLEVRPVIGGESVNGHPPSALKSERTAPFRVKSSRAKDNEKKGDQISLNDEVFRLRHISKGGDFEKRLRNHKITTVKDLYSVACTEQGEREMRRILGRGMSDALWLDTWQHVMQASANAQGSKKDLLDKGLYTAPAATDGADANGIANGTSPSAAAAAVAPTAVNPLHQIAIAAAAAASQPGRITPGLITPSPGPLPNASVAKASPPSSAAAAGASNPPALTMPSGPNLSDYNQLGLAALAPGAADQLGLQLQRSNSFLANGGIPITLPSGLSSEFMHHMSSLPGGASNLQRLFSGQMANMPGPYLYPTSSQAAVAAAASAAAASASGPSAGIQAAAPAVATLPSKASGFVAAPRSRARAP